MYIRPRFSAIGAALTLSAAGLASAAESTSSDVLSKLEALEAKVQSQQAEIAKLRGDRNDNWLDERRAAEVRDLIREVLDDADTRASLLAEGAVAGYDGGFWIGSPDGANLLKIGGEGQIRYIYTNAESDTATTDESEAGFQLRRFRLNFTGNFINKNLTYGIRLALDRSNGNVQFDNAFFGYKFAEGWRVQVGSFKPQFLHEENVSGFNQLAVERSYLADYFTLDYVQGAEVTFEAEVFRAAATIYDGSYTGFGTSTEFNNDRTEVAVAGRAEVKIAGDWKQFRDFTVWSTDKLGILVGVAAAYELGEEGSGGGGAIATNQTAADIFKWTADVTVEYNIFNFHAAVTGQSFNDGNNSNVTNLDGADQLGFVIQGGVFVVPDIVELFARYEWIDFDDVYYRNNGGSTQGGSGNIANDELGIVTVGVNYYLKKHNAKITLDVLWALGPVTVANTGAGVLASDDDGQVSIRAQAQFRF